MSLLCTTPRPTLAVAVVDARAQRRAAAKEASIPRRWARRLVVGFVMVFALIGFSGGTAQAWPWDVKDDITAFITNFCGPTDVPPLSDYTGVDTTLGLNNVENSTRRNTIVADSGALSGVAGNAGNGLERLRAAFGTDDNLVHPTYERYGFGTLRWTNFGSGCFSIGYWFSPISNLTLNLAVKVPMTVSMAVLHLAMDNNILYNTFTAVLQPFVKVFTAIFTPWIFFIAPIGVLWVWIKSKGSLQATMKAAVWVLCIYGVFFWMGNNTSRLVTTANNFVTTFAGQAAAKISETATGQASDPGNPLGAIDQALWHGVPYQTWLVGEVGDSQAGADQASEKEGKLGWGPAILNGLYIGTDNDAGPKVEAARQEWNNRSYAPNGDDTKTDAWTSEGGKNSWAGVPLLTVVKFMCNDTAKGSENSGDADKNKWFYGGNCDAAGAGTTSMVPFFSGQAYNQQFIAAYAGGFAALAVVLTISLAAIYLALQKMLFFFLLLFGPIFLAVSTFADEKRRAFAKRYFELLIANIIKQCVAVCVVLFVSFSMSNLLYPPADLGVPAIPWMLKPAVAMLFFIALILFLIPLRNILTAAAKGDTKIVDKTAQAPVDAAKTTAKVAALGAAAAATGGLALAAGGTSLGAAAMASGKVGQAGSLLTTAGRMMGRGGIGKAARVLGQGAHLAQQVGTAQLDKKGKAQAVAQGAMGLLNAPGNKYERDAQGKPTAKAVAQAQTDFKKMAQDGSVALRTKAISDQMMAATHAGHFAKTGQHLPTDPNHPANLKAAAIARENDRLDTQEQVREGRARNANGTPADSVATNGDPVQRMFAQQAQDLTDAPKFAQNPDVKANVTVSGADLLAGLNLTQAQAAANPGALLNGQSYAGGDTTAMDPRHPTTAALTQLKFAAVAGTDQDRQIALAKASDSIARHGVPDEVSSIRTTGDSATAFQGISVVGAMKPVSDNAPWQDRAQTAVTMQQALAQMPDTHPAQEKMQAYVSALADPGVPAGEVEALRNQAVMSVGATSAALSPQAYQAWTNYTVAKDDPNVSALDKQNLEKEAAFAIITSPPTEGQFADGSAEYARTWAASVEDRYAVTPDPVNEPTLFSVPQEMVAGAALRKEAALDKRADTYIADQEAKEPYNPANDPFQPGLPGMPEVQPPLTTDMPVDPPRPAAAAQGADQAPADQSASYEPGSDQGTLPGIPPVQPTLFTSEPTPPPATSAAAPATEQPMEPSRPGPEQPALFDMPEPTAPAAPEQPVPDGPAPMAAPAAAAAAASVTGPRDTDDRGSFSAPAGPDYRQEQPDIEQPALFDMPEPAAPAPVAPEQPVSDGPAFAPADPAPRDTADRGSYAAPAEQGSRQEFSEPEQPALFDAPAPASEPSVDRNGGGSQPSDAGHDEPSPMFAAPSADQPRADYDQPDQGVDRPSPFSPAVDAPRDDRAADYDQPTPFVAAAPVASEAPQADSGVRGDESALFAAPADGGPHGDEPTYAEPTHSEPTYGGVRSDEPMAPADSSYSDRQPSYDTPAAAPQRDFAEPPRSEPTYDEPSQPSGGLFAAPADPAPQPEPTPYTEPVSQQPAAASYADPAPHVDEPYRAEAPSAGYVDQPTPAPRSDWADTATDRVPDAQGWDLDGYGSGQTSATAEGFDRRDAGYGSGPYDTDRGNAGYYDTGSDDGYSDRGDRYRDGDRGQDAPVVVEVPGGGGSGIDRDDLRDALRDVRQDDAYMRPAESASFDVGSAPSEATEHIAAPDGAALAEQSATRRANAGQAPSTPGPVAESEGAAAEVPQDEETNRVFRPGRRKRKGAKSIFGGDDDGDDETQEDR